jgi:hypothetical protein
MEARLTHAVHDRTIDLDSFIDVWPLLSSKELLQALEASAGKKICIFIGESADARVEMLLDVALGRVGIDAGQGVRWGKWLKSGDAVQIRFEDSSECSLSGTEPGAVFKC